MKNILVILTIIIFCSQVLAESIKEETESIIREKLGNNITLEFIKYKIPADVKKEVETESRQKFYGDFVYVYKVLIENKIRNFVVVDNVYGKSMPITFMVIYDTEAKIDYSAIVKYREQYGGGVKSEDWNGQFIGRDSNSGYEVGKDISVISGATISANSIARGIKKLTLLISKIKNTL